MIYNSLICMLSDNNLNTNCKTLKLSSNPDDKKIEETYIYNINALNNLIIFCKKNNIKSLRISSNIFPLSTHKDYQIKCKKLIKKLLSNFIFDKYIKEIYLSAHPDQFILLSSLNQGVNLNSIIELEFYNFLRQWIDIKLVNIHIGSKTNGFEEHKNILLNNFQLLSSETQQIISFENDEKSYSFEETLQIAQESGAMMVTDFHHHRCYNRRKNEYKIEDPYFYDNQIYDKINEIIDTYQNKYSYPLFHISSPKGDWCKKFKEECAHSDYINENDYPKTLKKFSNDKIFILDIEAKMKEKAVLLLN